MHVILLLLICTPCYLQKMISKFHLGSATASVMDLVTGAFHQPNSYLDLITLSEGEKQTKNPNSVCGKHHLLDLIIILVRWTSRSIEWTVNLFGLGYTSCFFVFFYCLFVLIFFFYLSWLQKCGPHNLYGHLVWDFKPRLSKNALVGVRHGNCNFNVFIYNSAASRELHYVAYWVHQI